MEDGSLAVGLFNLSEERQKMTVTWDQLELEGEQRVRDVWRQQDVGQLSTAYTAEIASHGVQLIRLWPTKGSSF